MGESVAFPAVPSLCDRFESSEDEPFHPPVQLNFGREFLKQAQKNRETRQHFADHSSCRGLCYFFGCVADTMCAPKS